MMERFAGDAGRLKLIEALMAQKVVGGDIRLAERFASVGQLMEYKQGETIIEQGAGDDDVYFLVNGKADVFVNHQPVATREGGTLVGEMAAVDPSAPRSATVKAAAEVVVLRVPSEAFASVGRDFAAFSMQLFKLAAQRLRERSKFHLPANETPVMFVGSSVEGIGVVQEIQAGLKHDRVILRPWTTGGVFGLSRIPVEDLLRQADEADFALFVFGPDDKIASREIEYDAPRDNVIFEMGVFVGRLGRDRVFMVKDHDAYLKIPTDLVGLNPITYKCKPGCNRADVVGTVCTDIRRAIAERGVVLRRMKA